MKYLGAPQSGSQANTTASHNRAGQYYRNRRTPVNHPTARKTAIRTAFGAASKAWSGLTGAQQAAWTAYALLYPYIDALGSSIKLTGQQMYVAINTALQNVGAAQSATPPLSNVCASAGVPTFTSVSAGAMTLTPTGLGAAADYQIISFSRPMSGGTSFNATWWQQAVVAGNSVVAYVATTLYHVQFGIPPVGSRVFFKVTPMNQYGVLGTPYISYATTS
jgi:hypothetical protein